MHRFFLYALAIAVALGVASLHLLAIEHSLYWTFRWLDTPMHLLAGLVIGIGMGILLTSRMWRGRRFFFGVIAATLIIGTVWEIIEYEAGVSSIEPYFALDTLKDYVNDVIGALLGALLVQKLYVRS